MIRVTFFSNKDGQIYGFKAVNHGAKIVCAAVSALVINAANSIEAFTQDDIECDFDVSGGYLNFSLPDGNHGSISQDALLLMKSLYLGLKSVHESYNKELSIDIVQEEVQQ